MTMRFSEPLQRAVFERLTSDAVLATLVGSAIHDMPPPVNPADAPDVHLTLGEERVKENGSKTSSGGIHDFSVTVHSTALGFSKAKTVAGAVHDALTLTPISLNEGKLVDLRFLFANAERGGPPERRRIGLRFRAVIDGTP